MKTLREISVLIICVWVGLSFVGCASGPESKDKAANNQSKPSAAKDSHGY
jgi:hypothetical protein